MDARLPNRYLPSKTRMRVLEGWIGHAWLVVRKVCRENDKPKSGCVIIISER